MLLLRLPVVEDVVLREEHIQTEGPGDEGRRRVPVLDGRPLRGHPDHEAGEDEEDEPHEPLLSHFHCPALPA